MMSATPRRAARDTSPLSSGAAPSISRRQITAAVIGNALEFYDFTVYGVFADDMIDSYIDLKMTEVIKFEHTPHPVEYEMYYSA